jgi:anaerobic ribonucleoside-triphosphate reductase
MEAIEAFEEIMNICIKIVNIKLEDLQEFYNIEIYHIGAMTVNDVKDIYEETVTRYRNLHI